MSHQLETLFASLHGFGSELIDPTLSLAEVYSQPNRPVLLKAAITEDIEAFDNVSIKFATPVNDQPKVQPKEVLQRVASLIASGYFWDEDVSEITTSPLIEKSLQHVAVQHLKDTIASKGLEDVLHEFDAWTGTSIDILSPYGDVDFGHNVFADEFELDVPVKIYTQQDDIVVTADIPWIKVGTDTQGIPAQLDLKSVLALLPVRVNSREMKATFTDGQFKLEMPIKEEKPELKIKESV